MKKLFKLLSLALGLFCLTGCFREEVMTNNQTYATIYPIQYLTNYLYGNNKTITSIYPNGADVTNYSLTDKQKDTYSKGYLFIYNGLTAEKEIAREFLNKNKNLLLIDVSYGLKYDYALEELWLSPNNYLMLAKNIKSNLMEYTPSKITKEEIEAKFNELEITLSYMDAELRNIATEAKSDGNPVLVVSSNKLQFLEKYGFRIINLNSDEVSESTIKSNFKNGTYKDIYLCSSDTKTDLIKDLESSYKANVIDVQMMYTLTDKDVLENEDYLSIMNRFIDHIQNTTLS